MYAGLIFFLVPVLIFVVAFLYETYISFARLKDTKKDRHGYVSATWEITHTFLIIGLVMLFIFYSQSLTDIASAIFLPAFLAGLFLVIRGILYTYIFYVRKEKKVNYLDWLFACLHVLAAIFLVLVVSKAVYFVLKNHPIANMQFIAYYIPGLILTLALITVPMFVIYKIKD